MNPAQLKRGNRDLKVGVVGVAGERIVQHGLRGRETLTGRLIDGGDRLLDGDLGAALRRTADSRGRVARPVKQRVDAKRQRMSKSRGEPRLLQARIRLFQL